jgi:hypothetical protein
MFKLEIKTDNDEFTENLEGALLFALERVAFRITNDGSLASVRGGAISDSNGNTIGQWRYEPD